MDNIGSCLGEADRNRREELGLTGGFACGFLRDSFFFESTFVALGSSVFVVGVDDVEELYQKALKFGAIMRAPLSETVYPGADGNNVHVKSLGLYDPDGHFMECNQRL